MKVNLLLPKIPVLIKFFIKTSIRTKTEMLMFNYKFLSALCQDKFLTIRDIPKL